MYYIIMVSIKCILKIRISLTEEMKHVYTAHEILYNLLNLRMMLTWNYEYRTNSKIRPLIKIHS